MGRVSHNYGHSDSQRFMIREGNEDFSERFGSVHMNETAMEYFQNANLAGKTSE